MWPALMTVLAAILLATSCLPRPGASLEGDGMQTGLGRKFLALGDSYTIGEGVLNDERWPVQLATLLRTRGIGVHDPVIVARTGWTTAELMEGIDQANPSGRFDLVTLLIGVNNQYRGRSIDEYREEFRTLLRRAIAFAGGEPGRVVVLSIPDWGVTPYAEGRDRARIAGEIDRFNGVNREETRSTGARYVDVTGRSRSAAGDRGSVVGDGLHPSGGMYEAWARLALPEAVAALKSSR
jgi:lysophospholipase L1-like esterase